MREDHVAGRGADPGPAREDRCDRSAGLAQTQDDPNLPAEIAAAGEHLIWFSSQTRLPAMLDYLRGASRDLFWPVVLDWWSCCDATWPWRRQLLRELRRHGPGLEYQSAEDRARFAALPTRIPVFRGCSRARVRGASWSTDPEVAAGFARGHRGIRVPDAVVARAEIDKAAIFAFLTDREESEVLLDPRGLRRVRVTDAAERRP